MQTLPLCLGTEEWREGERRERGRISLPYFESRRLNKTKIKTTSPHEGGIGQRGRNENNVLHMSDMKGALLGRKEIITRGIGKGKVQRHTCVTCHNETIILYTTQNNNNNKKNPQCHSHHQREVTDVSGLLCRVHRHRSQCPKGLHIQTETTLPSTSPLTVSAQTV